MQRDPRQHVRDRPTRSDHCTAPRELQFYGPGYIPQFEGFGCTKTIAFETDLPRIEASDSQANPPFCDWTTGANCENPPPGAQFYPFFSTTSRYGVCTWQEGGKYLPGTTDNFGGSSTAEFGPLLKSVFPVAGFTTVKLFDNFDSGDMRNPAGSARG